MEQQTAEMLELIKNGMAEMPQIGSEAWNLYVSGVRASGIINISINISIYLLIVIIAITIPYFTYKISSEDNDVTKDDVKNNVEKDTAVDSYMRSCNGVHSYYHYYESDDGSDSLIMFLIGLIAVVFVIFCFVFFSSLGENITKIVSPEYYLINDIIKALR